MRIFKTSHLALLATFALWGCSSHSAQMADTGAVPKADHLPLSFQDAALDDPLPMAPNVTQGRLANGLTYYIRPNSEPSNRVELRLVVRAGSILEDDDQRGLAHLLEHMAFNGTEHFPANELVSYLESIGTKFGAHLNAYTTYNETVYMLQIPTDKPGLLDKGFLVLADWAQGMRLEDEEIEKERGVVLEEWRVRRGAGTRFLEKMTPLVYGERYADRLAIGTEESLKTFKPDAVRRFYHDWYRPDLMAVVVVGTTTPETVIPEIERYFAGLTNPDPERPREAVPVPDHPGTRYLVDIDPEFTMSRGVVTWSENFRWESTYRAYAKSIVQSLLYLMVNERLSTVARRPGAEFTRSMAYSNLITPSRKVHQVVVMLKPDAPEDGIAAVLTETRRIRLHGFTQDELDRAKERLMNRMEQVYHERDKTASRVLAAEIIRNFLQGEPMPGAEGDWAVHQRYVPMITLEDVNTLARNWMGPNNRAVLAALVDNDADQRVTEKSLAARVDEIDHMDVPPPQSAPTVETLMEVLPAPGEVTSEEHIDDLDLTVWTLANGVRVVVKPTDFKNDQVLFTGWRLGGHSLVPDEAYVAAVTAPQLTVESGAGPLNRIDLDRFLAGKTVAVTPFVRELAVGFEGGAAPDDLETMFQLIYLYATSPRFDEDAFDRVVEERKAFIANRARRPEIQLADEHKRQLYQDHPRYRPWTLEMVDQMSLEASTDAYLDLFSSFSDATFVFVGSVDPGALKPLVETYLGSLPSDDSEGHWKDVGATFPDHAVSSDVHAGVDPKSYVRITFFGDAPWTPRERYVLKSLTDVLNIRAREVIREALSGTYGIWSWGSLSRWPREQYTVTVSWSCDPARVDELRTALDEVLDEFRTVPIPESYLDKVKETQRRTYETNVEENEFWRDQLKWVYLNGLDPHEIVQYPSRIESLSGTDVQEAAKAFLVDDRKVETILYPAEPGTDADAPAEPATTN